MTGNREEAFEKRKGIPEEGRWEGGKRQGRQKWSPRSMHVGQLPKVIACCQRVLVNKETKISEHMGKRGSKDRFN